MFGLLSLDRFSLIAWSNCKAISWSSGWWLPIATTKFSELVVVGGWLGSYFFHLQQPQQKRYFNTQYPLLGCWYNCCVLFI